MSESKKRAIDYVRLDTDFTNPKLRSLYDGMGFVMAGSKKLNGRHYALYELKVASFRPSWSNMRVT